MLSFNTDTSENHTADEITLGKANLVLKAAGLNASLITMEQLKFTAPVIFVKIYEAFFNEKIPGINYSPSSRDEHRHNAELVVRALEARYKYQFLERVTGVSIVQGEKFSLESVIDLFYGVTQKSIDHKATMYDTISADEEKEFRKESALRDHVSSNTIRSYYHSQERYPNAIPGELKMLMERVTFLEKKLHGNLSPKSTTKKKKKSKKRRNKSESDNILHDSNTLDAEETRSIRDDEDAKSCGISKSRSFGNRKSRQRPTSAPLGGRPTKSPVRKPKYKTSADIDEITRKLCPEAPTLDDLNRIYEEKRKKKEEEDLKKQQREEQFDKMYTYDTLTGRKLLIAEMEQLTETRHQLKLRKQREEQKEAEKAARRKEVLQDPSSPTKAEWPGHRTETSVHTYVDRMAKIRNPNPIDKYPDLKYAQKYSSYRHLEKLDIVISVEHCCNCSYHSMSLRHKPDEYVSHANTVLKELAQVAHQCNPCARVGVVRFNANITKKSKESDVNSRVGALEVQVAFKNSNDDLVVELLYSKLKTRRWPSKTVIEKRLRSFMSNSDIQTFELEKGDGYDRQEVNGNHRYPVGVGPWEDTPLGIASWQYSPPSADGERVSFPVQWVFDSRGRACIPQFKNGQEVLVDEVENNLGYIESYQRPATVIQTFKSSEYLVMVEIKLKYVEEHIRVPEDSCFLPKDAKQMPKVFEMVNGVALPLFTVLYYAATHNKADWKVIDSRKDKTVKKRLSSLQESEDICLCRTSFFHQIHTLAWEAIEQYSTDDYKMADPRSGDVVDVQLSYSEAILDKLFPHFNSLVNINQMMRDASIDQTEEKLANESQLSLDVSMSNDAPKEMVEASDKRENDEPDSEAHHDSDEMSNKDQYTHEEDACEDIVKSLQKESHVVSSADKAVKEAISETLAENDESARSNYDIRSATLSFRERLQQVCLKISPPKEGSVEAGPEGNKIETSKYKAGAEAIFDSLDYDGNFELDVREFQEALVKFHLECDESEINKIRAGLDTDGNARISLQELLEFLHFESTSYRDLGEIWSSLRDCEDIEATSADSKVVVALVEMEKDLFSMSEFDSVVGSIVPASVFLDILKKYQLQQKLINGDVAVLLKVFGLTSGSKESIDMKKIPELPASEDVEGYIVKYEDFLSWLQPVDALKVMKRISRFVMALIKQDTAMAEDHSEFNSIDDVIKCVDPQGTGFVSLDNFQREIDSLGLPVSRAEVRVLYRHFGTSDGENMTHNNFKKMINGTHGAAIEPVKGSRQFRKQSVMVNSPRPKGLVSEPTEETLYEDDFFAVEKDTFIEDVYPVKFEPMMVNFSVLEIGGDVLEEDFLGRFQVEIKFLLQTLEVKIGREHRQSHGKRHIDVDWDPLHLSESALNNNADISVQLCVSQAVDSNRKNNIVKVLGSTFFSPRKLMEFDKNTFFNLPLSMTIENGSEVNLNLFGRISDCHRAKMKKQFQSSNFDVSFDDIRQHYDDDDEDEHDYTSDHNKSNTYEDDHDFLANFEEEGLFEESKAGKEIEIDVLKEYCAILRIVELSDLKGLKSMPLRVDIMLDGSRMEVVTDSDWSWNGEGDNASDSKYKVITTGYSLNEDMIEVKVFDDITIEASPSTIGKSDVSMTHATYDHDKYVVLSGDIHLDGKCTGHAKLYFEFEEHYVPDDPVHDDRSLLLQFVKATSEKKAWNDDMMWSENTELKNWLGVDCNHDIVTALYLGSNSLNGKIPTLLCQLENLTRLELFANELYGSIPENIGKLTKLKTLLLNDNNLSGSIPQSLSRCTELEEIDLRDNSLTGNVPEGLALSSLTTLHLGNNAFQGPLPLSLTTLKKLRFFSCNLCPYDEENFSRVFPYIRAHADVQLNRCPDEEDKEYWGIRSDEEENLLEFKVDLSVEGNCFESWVKSSKKDWSGVVFDDRGCLRSLILCNQQIGGSIPSTISLLQNVVYLDLSDNEFRGDIPSEVFQLSNLQHLYLNNLSLEGPLSSDISQLVNLKTLSLAGNQLNGPLPVELSALEILEILALKNNNFEGCIPEEMLMLEHLRELDLSYNSLTNEIPDLSDLLSLERLVLAGNQLTGAVPDTISALTNLEHLDISFNPLVGRLPSSLSSLTRLVELDIQMTKIEVEGMDYNMRKKMLLKKVKSLSKISL